MVDTLRELLHSSLSEQSRKQYSRAWVVFTEFYTRYQGADLHLPVSTACIALFISFLCAKGLAPATINSYLSAIAYVHKIKGHYDPTKSFLVEKLLVAVGRRGQADVRMPISRPLLYELVRALQHTSPSAYRRSLFGAMFMTAFYGFFRIGELSCNSKQQVDTVVQFDQVTFLKQSSRVTAVKIVITKFKHNTNNRPFVITIESEPSEQFCPVQTLIDYIKLRGYHQGPLFTCAAGGAISTNNFNTELRRALNFCGLDCSRYKSHSFRIGAACHASEKGFSDSQIRALGRWSSDAFRTYIRPPSLKANKLVFKRFKDTSQAAVGSPLYRSVRSCYAVVIFTTAI